VQLRQMPGTDVNVLTVLQRKRRHTWSCSMNRCTDYEVEVMNTAASQR